MSSTNSTVKPATFFKEIGEDATAEGLTDADRERAERKARTQAFYRQLRSDLGQGPLAVNAAARLVASIDANWRARIQKAVASLQSKYKLTAQARKFMAGYCAVFCVDLYKNNLIPPGFVPYSVFVGEEEHVVLINKEGDVIDPTGNQFNLPLVSVFDSNTYRRKKRLNRAELESVRLEALELLKPTLKKSKPKSSWLDNVAL